jgi:hypothetical protein
MTEMVRQASREVEVAARNLVGRAYDRPERGPRE